MTDFEESPLAQIVHTVYLLPTFLQEFVLVRATGQQQLVYAERQL